MDYKNVNDYEILYLIGEDDQYREALFDKYKPVLCDICSKFYPSLKKCGMEFDDLYQEALIALNKAIDSYDGRSALFYSYAYVCINRHLSTFYRYATTEKKNVLNYAFSMNQFIGENTLTYFDIVSDKNAKYNSVEINLDLIEFKNMLSDNESRIFELRWNGFSYREISILLDMNVKNVDYYIQKIKKKLHCYF